MHSDGGFGPVSKAEEVMPGLGHVLGTRHQVRRPGSFSQTFLMLQEICSSTDQHLKFENKTALNFKKKRNLRNA